jgi:RNase H-fold protein (predicted Holliday junction resolvase)
LNVLAVDPGRDKCGIAVCRPGAVLAHRVIPVDALADVVQDWVATYRVEAIAVGNSTGAADARRRLAGCPVPVVGVDERGTTLVARTRYFLDHPPRGWRRLIPRSLLVPPEPYDDYAAILLGEAYLEARGRGSS